MGKYDNDIFGVTDIYYFRRGEKEDKFLAIKGRRAKYFEFLATNANVRMRKDFDKEDSAWIKQKIREVDPSVPIPEFANALSVQVLLLCENGTKAVMGMRSEKTVFRGGKISPSVEETVSPTLEGKETLDTEINIFEVIKRGIKEELGIDAEEINEIYVTSFAFDHEVLDYKFTAIATTSLSQKEIDGRFNMAIPKDKWENKELKFIDYPIKSLDLGTAKKEMNPEAIASIIMGMAVSEGWKHLRKILAIS